MSQRTQNQGSVRASKARRRPEWLLIATGIVPVFLLLVAFYANRLSNRAFHDVNLCGSLRYRCLWIYSVTHGGHDDVRQQIFRINAIRTQLRRCYPNELAATDTAWTRFSSSLQRTGSVDWDTANTTRDSLDRLTTQIEAKASALNTSVAILLVAGFAGLALSLGSALWLLRGLQQAKASLSAKGNFQEALLDSLQEGIVACDAAGTLTHSNRATREFHGLSLESVPKEQWATYFDLFTADGTEPLGMHEVPLFRALQGECVRDLEIVIAPRDGTPRTLLVNCQAIYGPEGETLGAVAALHDVTLSRQTERELARLAAVVETSNEAIVVADLDGVIVGWNNGAKRVYGYSSEEMIGQHASVLALPDEVSYVPQAAAAARRGEAIPPMAVRRRRKDGVLIDVCLSFSLMRDRVGNITSTSVLARDVTAQKRAEAALAESEERLRRLCDAAFEGIAVSQGGVIIDANPAFAALFGYASVEEAIGASAAELAVPLSGEFVFDIIHNAGEATYEAVCQRVDGSTFPVEVRGRMTSWNGEPTRVTAIRDIAARKAMEEALRVSDMRFRTAVDAMQEGLVLQNQTGNILMCNGSAERILGLTADQMRERDLLDPRWRSIRKDGSEFPGTEHPAMVALQTGQSQKDVVMGIPKPDGTLTWISINAVPLFTDGDDQPYSVVVTFADITERTMMEERFRALFDHSSDAYLIVDEVGIIDCNAATIAMLRCHDKAGVLALHPAVLSPEFQPDGRRSDEKCLEMDAIARQMGVHRFEWMHQKMDGEVFPVEVTLTAIALQGSPVLLVVWHDLTDRMIAEQQVKDLASVLLFQKEELERTNAELEALATTDGLTGLKNHRCFQEQLVAEISAAARYQSPLSIVLLDVDKFKTFNDTFGHPAGDAVLRKVARILQDECRLSDIAARYGGEEFILLLPRTDAAGALAIAERVRKAIEETPWQLRPVTASFGIASFGVGCESGSELICRADQALYQSKEAGRNTVTHLSQAFSAQTA